MFKIHEKIDKSGPQFAFIYSKMFWCQWVGSINFITTPSKQFWVDKKDKPKRYPAIQAALTHAV